MEEEKWVGEGKIMNWERGRNRFLGNSICRPHFQDWYYKLGSTEDALLGEGKELQVGVRHQIVLYPKWYEDGDEKGK